VRIEAKIIDNEIAVKEDEFSPKGDG